jgi:Uma2 family endonuclease
MGELPHGLVQGRLIYILQQLAAEFRITVVPEIRLQISPTRFRVADVAVWRAGPIGTRIPTVLPFLAVEILSMEDRLTRMQPKIQEYLQYGIEHVWVLDPEDGSALSYTAALPAGMLVDVLRTQNPVIEIALNDVLNVLG